jgi:hypothetical protein
MDNYNILMVVFSSTIFMFQEYIGFTCFKWYRSNIIRRHERSFCCLFDAEKWMSNWGVMYSEQYASLHKLRDSNLLNYIVLYRFLLSSCGTAIFRQDIWRHIHSIYVGFFLHNIADELQSQHLGPFRQNVLTWPDVKILYIRNMAAMFLLDYVYLNLPTI